MTKIIDIEDAESMNKINLRPCPFCNSNRVELKRHSIISPCDSRKHWWYIICNNCGIKLENITDDSIQNTANSWNTRHGKLK